MDNGKYEILLSELAEVIQRKNDKIALQEHVINNLTKQLEAIENSIKYSGKPQDIERR